MSLPMHDECSFRAKEVFDARLAAVTSQSHVTQRKLMITHHTDAREEHSACMGSLERTAAAV